MIYCGFFYIYTMSIRATISTHLSDLFDLAFPNNCMLCSRSLLSDEKDICFSCINTFPETGYHRLADNPVAQHFWGRVPLAHAAAYLHIHTDNIVQDMVHLLKYRGKTRIGAKLGRLYGYRLLEADSLIRDIELIVPVPLHPSRQRQRGYNQCDHFAQGLSEILGVPYAPAAMARIRENVSQTKHSRYDRWGNVAGIFALAEPETVANKHILLVDDVVTTGATIESCAGALLSGNNVRVSVATIATAGR